MALVQANRVKETSTTTGTGTYDLAGAETGFRTFVAGVGTGNTCYYCATDDTDWEVGLGTVTDASPDTLARTEIIGSSNGNAAVNWGAGTKTLFVTSPAERTGTWVKTVSQPGSSFSDFTSVSGTWSSNGTEIIQTDTGAADRHAYITTSYDMADSVVSADVYMVTGAGNPSRVGLIPGYNATFGGSTAIYLNGDTVDFDSLKVDRATQTALLSVSATDAYATWINLTVRISGLGYAVYQNGTFKFNVRNITDQNPQINPDYLGLYSYQASVKFRNIKIWTCGLPV